MSMQNVEGALGYDSYDLLGYRQPFVNNRNGRGASTPLPAHETSFTPEEGFDQGSDLHIEQQGVPSFDVMLQAEIEEFLAACALNAKEDARARQEAANAESLLFALHKLQEEGVAFSGNTSEELDAVVEYMEIANPDATDEERVNLVYELTDYTRELRTQLIAEQDTESTETTDSPQGLVPRREVLTS